MSAFENVYFFCLSDFFFFPCSSLVIFVLSNFGRCTRLFWFLCTTWTLKHSRKMLQTKGEEIIATGHKRIFWLWAVLWIILWLDNGTQTSWYLCCLSTLKDEENAGECASVYCVFPVLFFEIFLDFFLRFSEIF